MRDLPDYGDLGRRFFFQCAIDVATILAWCLLGMLLAMIVCAPLLWAMLLAFGVL